VEKELKEVAKCRRHISVWPVNRRKLTFSIASVVFLHAARIVLMVRPALHRSYLCQVPLGALHRLGCIHVFGMVIGGICGMNVLLGICGAVIKLVRGKA
jgi:hypothetical protein